MIEAVKSDLSWITFKGIKQGRATAIYRGTRWCSLGDSWEYLFLSLV